jgi:NhaA family Na+:H+ antiporter
MTKTLRWLFDSTLLLPIGAVIALVWANVAPESYGRLAHALEFPINEIGMAFFFALAAKEVVEATVPGGALYPWRRAVVPIFGAAGGMLGPALTYLLLVKVAGDPTLVRGWAIPCATDIAFSYLVAVSLFGRSHPVLPFLLLLAIADDAFGLIILAVFYPVRAVHPALVLGLVGLAAAAALVMRRRKVKSFWPYILIGGSLAWGGLFVGGLHPALALVPVVPFLPHAAHDAGPLVQEPAAHDTLNEFEHSWKSPYRSSFLPSAFPMPGFPFEQLGRRPGRSWERSWQGSRWGSDWRLPWRPSPASTCRRG